MWTKVNYGPDIASGQKPISGRQQHEYVRLIVMDREPLSVRLGSMQAVEADENEAR